MKIVIKIIHKKIWCLVFRTTFSGIYLSQSKNIFLSGSGQHALDLLNMCIMKEENSVVHYSWALSECVLRALLCLFHFAPQHGVCTLKFISWQVPACGESKRSDWLQSWRHTHFLLEQRRGIRACLPGLGVFLFLRFVICKRCLL